jgi:hypothetical protein
VEESIIFGSSSFSKTFHKLSTFAYYLKPMTQLTWLVTGCSSGLGEEFIRGILARGDKAIAITRGPVSRIG